MTDEQAQRVLDEMVDLWGDKLPNPDHEPIRFHYYMKLFKYGYTHRLEKAISGTADE